MGSSVIPGSANEHSLMDQRLDTMDQRLDAIDQRLAQMTGRLDQLDAKVDGNAILLAKLDTKMNIVMGMLGAAGASAFFLLVRMLLLD